MLSASASNSSTPDSIRRRTTRSKCDSSPTARGSSACEAGACVLISSVNLVAGKSVVEIRELPPAAYAAGKLTLALEHISGPNAVVSDVEILSSNPRPLGVVPPPPLVLPRLSPRPAEVSGVSALSVDLAGTWKFNSAANGPTADIQVPGEWVMQGFTVAPGKAAHYRRHFSVPADWRGKRIKLRCDGVYSDAVVSLNGREAGRHLGGMTPFELDLTTLVEPGKDNTIALAVTSESLADRLGCCSQYASHPLGGITRKIRMFVLPEANLSSLHVSTRFDKDFRDATLGVELAAANEGPARPLGLQAVLTLTAPDGANVPLAPHRVALDSLKESLSIPVSRPLKWDNEHPNLYRLAVRLEAKGKLLETVTQRIGFRQVEVRGNRLFVNNVPVKLHGVCRHEVHPLRGRSLTPELWRKDAELFRVGNCNFIRTSHYPPARSSSRPATNWGCSSSWRRRCVGSGTAPATVTECAQRRHRPQLPRAGQPGNRGDLFQSSGGDYPLAGQRVVMEPPFCPRPRGGEPGRSDAARHLPRSMLGRL